MIKPHQNSLFAILLRSPWWASLLIAVALYFASRVFLPPVAAAASTFPWVGLALYALWKQSKVPGATRVAETLERLRAMSWEEFAPLMEAMLRRDGFDVTATKGTADFELRKQGYLTLASCRRWKVAQAGVAPVQELADAAAKAEARNALYVTAGEVSPKAVALAAEHQIEILSGAGLVAKLGRLPKRTTGSSPETRLARRK